MKKTILTFFFALVASVGTIFAESGTCGKNLTWDLTNGVLTISGSGTMTNYSGEVKAPWYSYCSSIKKVSIGNSVTSIGNYAFYGCKGLTSVTIPNSVTSIGREAFKYCHGLTSVTIPNSVTSIGVGAFSGCSGLTSVTIGNSVTSIGTEAFYQCFKLTSITIPNSVTSIGQYAFDGCKGLTSVTIPNSVTSIGNSAFASCSGLTSITIPNSVTSIGEKAFQNCTSLTSITIPNSVTSIGDVAFAFCTGLTSVTNYATTPQTINSDVFYSVALSSCTLYVPKGSVDLYQAAEVWKRFGNILPISAEKTEVTTPTIEPDATSAEIAWPQVSGAFSYELVIKDASGNTICTLVFNAQGQLTSITFNAPARENGEQQTQSAGFVFTVNGLEPGTQYNYSIIAKNESGATLNTEQGSFTTTGGTQALENPSAKFDKSRKLLRNGQVLIQKGDHIYTLTGQEIIVPFMAKK